MFKDKKFLAWRRKSISLKKQSIRKKAIKLKKQQNFLLKMQKKRAFQKFKNFLFYSKKKDKEKKINRKKDNLFYKINARFLKRGLDTPYSIERWIYKDE
tara:strand:+ start:124 stop:420 length:297 start_codon:yes stop_codon:yes gene_type:complete